MPDPRLDERGVEAAARAVRAKLPPGAQFGPALNVLDAIEFSEVAIAAYFAALDRAVALSRLADVIGPHMDIRCGHCGGTGLDPRSNLDCTPCSATGYVVRTKPWREKAALEVRAVLTALGLPCEASG